MGPFVLAPLPCLALVASGPTDPSGCQLSVLPDFKKRVDWCGAVGAVTRSLEAGELGFFAAFLPLPELRNLFLIFF